MYVYALYVIRTVTAEIQPKLFALVGFRSAIHNSFRKKSMCATLLGTIAFEPGLFILYYFNNMHIVYFEIFIISTSIKTRFFFFFFVSFVLTTNHKIKENENHNYSLYFLLYFNFFLWNKNSKDSLSNNVQGLKKKQKKKFFYPVKGPHIFKAWRSLRIMLKLFTFYISRIYYIFFTL